MMIWENEFVLNKVGSVVCADTLESRMCRGSSVGRMPDSQSREPGFESPLLPFRSLGNASDQWWKCE